jgi:hypothetical protein
MVKCSLQSVNYEGKTPSVLTDGRLGGQPSRARYVTEHTNLTPGQRSRYGDPLRAGRSGERDPVGARFSAPVHNGPGARPASCMGTASLSRR